jgi:hypothetical protein
MAASPPPVMFLDLDECAAGAIWPSRQRPRRPLDRRVFAAILEECEARGASVHLLTNRPPGQLPIVAQVIGGPARYHMAESGLSCWLPDENRAVVNPAYRAFAEEVRPEMVARLRAALGLGWDDSVLEEFGTRLVTLTVFPLGSGHAEVERMVATCRELLSDLPVQVRQGEGADILPAGADKVIGCRWAQELHPALQGGALDWSRALYVEDSATGIAAARYMAERRGLVAAVANARAEFRDAVADLGGYLCRQGQEAGVLEAIRAWMS